MIVYVYKYIITHLYFALIQSKVMSCICIIFSRPTEKLTVACPNKLKTYIGGKVIVLSLLLLACNETKEFVACMQLLFISSI